MSAIPYCDHHGWRWDPGRGPSPCVGETLSFWLAVFGCLCSGLTNRSYFTVQQRASLAGSFGAKVHGAQIALSLAQSIVALIGGVLSARPSGMLCGALLLHTLGWTVAWLASAFAISRNADLCKRLVWWWLGGAVTNSVVLSSLHAASHREGGHGLPAEIGFLSWVSFFGNTLLVLLQLAKPELDDTESVYVRVLDHGTVLRAGTGWQAFWAGGGGTGAFDASGRLISRRRGRDGECLGGFFRCCCCCCGYLGSGTARPNNEALQDAGVAWPLAGVEGGISAGTLNDSLLESVGLESSSGSGMSAIKSKRGLSRAAPGSANEQGLSRCFGRISRSLSSMLRRSDKAAREDRDGPSEAGFPQRDYFRSNLHGASPLAAGMRTAPGSRRFRDRSFVSPSYYVTFASRPPPQPAAPVFGVSITRWRLVDADGVPAAQGSPSDVASTKRGSIGQSVQGSSSSRTANLRGSDARPPPPAEPPSASSTNTATKTGLRCESEGDKTLAQATALTLQLELSVRSSGRGEIDWWGRHGSSDPDATSGQGFAAAKRGANSGRAAAASDWRVWRSCPADVVALYDALALRFGPEFCGRVPRPQIITPTTIAMVPSAAFSQVDDEGSQAATAVSLTSAAAPHRADIQRDARTVGAFLRGLLGQRQFLSTAVMDFLAPPPRISLEMSESMLTEGNGDPEDDGDEDGKSWDGSDGGSLDSEDTRAPRRGRNDFGGASVKSFRPGTAEPSCTGGAIAGAALASDYGAWLKRLAVRMRRAAPAGNRFVRLRRIGPAVTGDEVVRWLVSSSGECVGDRASAVRLGQDMVSNRLLTPLCAGYDEHLAGTADESAASKQPKQRQRNLPRSFDDGVGWLFAYAGEALRDPFAPPPPPEVSVMKGTRLRVSVAEWIETSDNEGPHACFVVHTEVEVTQEAWDIPRRYRDFTQLRKRLLRLGIDLPKAMEARGGSGGDGSQAGSLAPDLPKKTWRSNKFDRDHLNARRAALEAYLKAAVEAALATPHLAGNLLMRFLDPEEANLRLLCDPNPFASCSPIARAPVARGAARSVRDVRGLERKREDDSSVVCETQEAEDFNSLTDSLGGFG